VRSISDLKKKPCIWYTTLLLFPKVSISKIITFSQNQVTVMGTERKTINSFMSLEIKLLSSLPGEGTTATCYISREFNVKYICLVPTAISF
jgi:hypothetical protein